MVPRGDRMKVDNVQIRRTRACRRSSDQVAHHPANDCSIFPFDRLKIDRSFIADVLTDDQNAAIVAALIQLARALDIEVIAEGVETQAQFEIIRAAGCDYAQGFLFGRKVDLLAEGAVFDEGAVPSFGKRQSSGRLAAG